MRILAAGTYYQKVLIFVWNATHDHDPKLQQIVGYYELPFLSPPKTRDKSPSLARAVVTTSLPHSAINPQPSTPPR